MRPIGTLMLCAWLATPAALVAQETGVEVTTASDSELEAATRDQLLRLLREFDVSRWIYTTDVVIDGTVIPHSHPVLTLHARHLGDDHALLSTFLHEQFHWLEEERAAARDAAMRDFRSRFPDAPAGGPTGARDQQSTFLHLIVCDLELQAMTALVGAPAARRLLEGMTHYTWIYDKVLNDPVVRDINRRHGFIVP